MPVLMSVVWPVEGIVATPVLLAVVWLVEGIVATPVLLAVTWPVSVNKPVLVSTQVPVEVALFAPAASIPLSLGLPLLPEQPPRRLARDRIKTSLSCLAARMHAILGQERSAGYSREGASRRAPILG